jgi:peptide/nickel transport system permease protein
MIGLILVCVLILMSIFADFFAPMDPKATDVGFAPPQMISFHDKEGSLTFPPRVYALGESEELDPVTFQPIVGPDYDNPRNLGFFVKGAEYKLFGLIPASRHLFGSVDGQPVHFLGTDKFGRDVLSRAIIGSRISLTIALTVVFIVTVIGTTVGMVSGYFGGSFDTWVQRFVEVVLAFPQLPLYLALTSLIPVTAPTNVFLGFVIIVMSALGWAQMSREVRGKTLALARIDYVRAAMAVGATDRRIIFQHIFPNVMSHVIVARDAAHSERRAARILPRLPRLCREAAADLLGSDAAGYGQLFRHRHLSMDPGARRLRPDHRLCVQCAGRRSARCRRSLLR